MICFLSLYKSKYQKMSLDLKPKKSNLFFEISENIDYLNMNSSDRNIDFLKDDIFQYQIKGKIGEGMFGKVKLGIHLITKEKVAIKIFDKGKIKKEKEQEYIEREISILKKLNHYNIIKLYNIIHNDNFIFLIQEYVPNGELLHFLENGENINLSEKDICKIYQQIISGIEYLHEVGIAHRDLKLENILLNFKNDIKIIDFGLSNKYNKDNEELLQSSCGSPCYAAPEMIKGAKYHGVDTDIWSSGIILYLMLCKTFPFNDKNNSKLYQKILCGKFNLPSYLSNEAKDLLSKLLKVNPNERIKLNEIKKHPWFNLINIKKNYFFGIDINKVIMPLDEDVIKEMKMFGIEPKVIIDNILRNYYNNITTTYNLLLQKKIRKGKKSIADLCSNLFMDYLKDERNKLSFYKNDIELIIKTRINNLTKSSKNIKQIKLLINDNSLNHLYNNTNKILKLNFLFRKINPKILKANNDYSLNQQTERQKRKGKEKEKEKEKDILLLNIPIKSHTIDHLSKSKSPKKKNFKSPNLTRFNTRKYLKMNQNIISSQENQKQPNKRESQKYELNTKTNLYSRLLNKRKMNQNNNHTVSGNKNNNFKTIIYNRSVDNKYRKEQYNYLNYNYFKLNNIKDIKKKVYGTIDNKRRIDSQNSNSPLMTGAFNEQKYMDNSLMANILNNGYLEKSKNKNKKNIIKLNKRKKEEKIDVNTYNKNRINNYNNYYLMKKNNSLTKNFINSSGFNNNNATNNLKLKKNNFLIEDMNKTKYKNKIVFSLSQEKDRKENKKIKTKKASSFSIDLNLKYNNKNEYNIYTNRPKRKNVMKFVNKNNMNLRIRNIYNNYDYCYRKENKNNINNKSLDL